MSDFKDLLEKTMDKAREENSKAFYDETTLDCGHTVQGYTKSLILSGTVVGLKSYKSFTACTSCAHVLYDKAHEKHKTVKQLIRRKLS